MLKIENHGKKSKATTERIRIKNKETKESEEITEAKWNSSERGKK